MDVHIYIRRFWILVLFFVFFCVVRIDSQNAFFIEPEDATIVQGSGHTFGCTVNQTYLNGFLLVAWIRDSVVISQRNNIDENALSQFVGSDQVELDRYSVSKKQQNNQASYDLVIDNTQGVDAGEYQCVICTHPSDSYKCTTITEHRSRVATYDVSYTPAVPDYPQCTGMDSSATVSVGTDVEITCTSDIGDPKVDLKWDIDGNDITGAETIDSNMVSLSYTFRAALSDSGKVFTCSSTSTGFPSYAGSCSFPALSVVDMPVVTLTSGAAEYEEGSEANFTCKASSATSVTFDWSVGSISNDRYTKADTAFESIIRITAVELSDHQTLIKCTVTNSQGQRVEDQVYLEVVGGPTRGPTTRSPTTKPITTEKVTGIGTTITTSAPDDSGGSIGAAIGGAFAGFVIVLVLILACYCFKKRKSEEEKNSPGKVMNIGAPQNGVGNHVPPVKKVEDVDDIKKEPLPMSDEPDVVPRQHNGNHDPRTWWRESMPGDAYTKDENEYPTIKRMQMPFTQRQPSLENLQERVEMDNYRSNSDYDEHHSESYAHNAGDGRYDYNPSPSIHSDNVNPLPINNYHDYHNPQFDHPDDYQRPPSLDNYSDYNYPGPDPRLQQARSPVNYGAPPQDRYDERYYGSYDRRNPGNYPPRPGIDNPSYHGDMYVGNDMYGRNPNYTENYDPQGISESGSVFSNSTTDRYYEPDHRIQSSPFYPDNNGYASSDRPISPYADIPPGQSNNSSDVLYMQGHDVDLSDPSYV